MPIMSNLYPGTGQKRRQAGIILCARSDPRHSPSAAAVFLIPLTRKIFSKFCLSYSILFFITNFMKDKEEWVLIPGYSDYMVSSHGRVKSFRMSKPKILKHSFSRGYPQLGLRDDDGRQVSRGVHRWVLLGFRGECPEGCEGSHLDGDKTNNHIDNLVWEDRKSNNLRKLEHGTYATNSKLNDDLLREIYELRMFGYTCVEIAEKYDIDVNAIYKATGSKNWKHLNKPDHIKHRGSTHYNTKLSDSDVLDIRRLRRSGLSYIDLGKRYSMSPGTICNICLGRSWKHLPF